MFGAATRIRTGDLILTKDVLYQLSHSSDFACSGLIITVVMKVCQGFCPGFPPYMLIYYSKRFLFCQGFFEKKSAVFNAVLKGAAMYKSLRTYLKEKYSAKVGKICIDGGFSCPNRDGKCGTGGCIFCSERGSGDHIRERASIKEQVEAALYAASPNDKFIAYFQNFTNTYAPVQTLKEKYDEALIDERIVVLAIGTRPDCITEEIAELIASYKDRVDVWVELGLQSAADKTARLINRGYETSVYLSAVEILKRHKINTVTHVMIGLPGEGMPELEETVRVLNEAEPWGLKIHSVYVAKGTRLEKMYQAGEYEPIGMDEYIERAVYVLKHIKPDTVIHRVTGDCPRDMLVAPEWNSRKNEIINRIRANFVN